jgi:signal transduction histidine kinase
MMLLSRHDFRAPRAGQWVASLGVALLTASAATLYQWRLDVRRLQDGIHLQEGELARSMADEDWLLASRIGNQLLRPAISKIEFVHGDRILAGVTARPSEPRCPLRAAVPIRRYGLVVADAIACFSVGSLMLAALWNSTIWCVVLGLTCLALLGAMVSLRRYRNSLRRSLDVLEKFAMSDHLSVPPAHAADPVLRDVRRLLDAGVARERAAEARAAQVIGAASVAALAAQVAHDIRSPLAALTVATSDLTGVSHGTRTLIQAAVMRIGDIANVLLSRYRTENDRQAVCSVDGSNEASLRADRVCLWACVEGVATEARARFQAMEYVTLRITHRSDSYGAFVLASRVELCRLISNLINNGAEAAAGSCEVEITVRPEGAFWAFSVKDTGRGLPQEVLCHLGEAGLTSGKPGGSGLGLSHARRCAERWGGALRAHNLLAGGAEVTITLPKACPPVWFLPELTVRPGQRVVIADDDPSMHHVWGERLAKSGAILVHCWSPSQLRREAQDPQALHLVDYEFSGASVTGLEVLREVGGVHRVLVTSRAQDEGIQEQCAQTGVSLLAKECVSRLPLRIIA